MFHSFHAWVNMVYWSSYYCKMRYPFHAWINTVFYKDSKTSFRDFYQQRAQHFIFYKMILTLSSENGELKLPFLNLDQNKEYEIGIHSIGAALTSSNSQPVLLNVRYDGMRFQHGVHPYSMMMHVIGRSGFNLNFSNPIFFTLRANQLQYTAIDLFIEGSSHKFTSSYTQIEIRERTNCK